MIEVEDLLNQAEEIFFELALENLSNEKLELIQAHPANLFLELHESFSGEWEALLYEDVTSSDYAELGVYVEVEGRIERLALMLMALDMQHNKECHIQW